MGTVLDKDARKLLHVTEIFVDADLGAVLGSCDVLAISENFFQLISRELRIPSRTYSYVFRVSLVISMEKRLPDFLRLSRI